MQLHLERSKSAGYLTNWAARLFARAMDRRLKSVGLSSGHMTVLFALDGGKELSQKVLAEIAAVEQPTMAATLSRMHRDGLVTKRPDPRDGRGSLLSLTPAAREKIDEVRRAVFEINGKALSGFSEEERATFLAMLRRIIDVLGEDDGSRAV